MANDEIGDPLFPERKEDFEEDDIIVILTNDDGDEEEFLFVLLIEVEGEQYALMHPVDGKEAELNVFHYETDGDDSEFYSDVIDKATFDKVVAEADKVFDAMEESGANDQEYDN